MTTKFDFDEYVWGMHNNEPKRLQVKLITIYAKTDIVYEFNLYGKDSKYDFKIKENLLFNTKQELIESL